MEDYEVTDGLSEFYQEVDEVHSKWYNKDITSDQAMKEIEELLSKHYGHYSGAVYGI